MIRVWVGFYIALAAATLASTGLLLLYSVAERITSWPGRVGASLIAGLAVFCAYFLADLSRFIFGVYNLRAWQKSKMHVTLLMILVAYGGLMPWLAYLTAFGHPVAWWALVFCLPFYLGAVWYAAREFRRNLVAAANEK